MGNIHIGNKTTNNNYFCFPPDELVVNPDGQQQKMRDLKVGDDVLVACKDHTVKASKIKSFAHEDLVGQAEYYKFVASTGECIKSVQMTGDHFILVAKQGTGTWKYRPAKEVELGDALLALEDRIESGGMQLGAAIVSSITQEVKHGFFAPITDEGTIVVGDGIVASCYAVGNSHEAAHLALKIIDLAFVTSDVFHGLQSCMMPQKNDGERA